jgi:hypothetical protein
MSSRSQRPSAPPRDEHEDDPLDPPEDRWRDYDDRPSLEKILPELLRRGLEVGRGPLGKVGESFVPRELASSVVAQLGDARSGIVKAVAHEVGRFLREADIASEIRKVLVGLDIEAEVKLRFNQRADGSLEPEVSFHRKDQGSAAAPKPAAPKPAAPASPDAGEDTDSGRSD